MFASATPRIKLYISNFKWVLKENDGRPRAALEFEYLYSRTGPGGVVVDRQCFFKNFRAL